MEKQALYIGSEVYRKAAFGQNHPLSYARQESVLDVCRELGWLPSGAFVQSPAASFETITHYHDRDYVQALKWADELGKASVEQREKYNFGTMENPLFKGVYNRAATTVGGSIRGGGIGHARPHGVSSIGGNSSRGQK